MSKNIVMTKRIYPFLIILIVIFILAFNTWATSIALIVDASENIKKALPIEKKSINTIIELLSLTRPDSTITVVKFGCRNQRKIIINNDNIYRKNLNLFFEKISKNMTTYKGACADLLGGISLLLNSNNNFDYTFFVTDGKINYPNDIKDIKNIYGKLKKLGKVVFIILPDTFTERLNAHYKIALKEWQKIFDNAKIINLSHISLLNILYITNPSINSNISGCGIIKIHPGKIFDLKRYGTSPFVVIFVPKVKIKSTSSSDFFYRGCNVSYYIFKSKQNKEKIYFDSYGVYSIFFVEFDNIKPHIMLIPNKKFYNQDDKIDYKLYFTAGNSKKRITNKLFKKSLFVKLTFDKRLIKGNLLTVEKGVIDLKSFGIKKICVKYSYLPFFLSNQNCILLKKIMVKEKLFSKNPYFHPKTSYLDNIAYYERKIIGLLISLMFLIFIFKVK